MCLNNNIPVLFVGPTGTGKSAIVLDYLVNLHKEKFIANIINFSAKSTSMMVSYRKTIVHNFVRYRICLDTRNSDVQIR